MKLFLQVNLRLCRMQTDWDNRKIVPPFIATVISVLGECLITFFLFFFFLFIYLFFVLFIPQRSKTDVRNFDTDFTREEPKLTPTDKNVIANINQDEFKDFSFVNAKFASDGNLV